MKYANRLSDEELEELFKLFMADDEELVSIDIDRMDDFICVSGNVVFPDHVDADGTIEVEDYYEFTDYHVRVYTHSGNMDDRYKRYMYEKFGEQYAVDYLLCS